MTNGVRNTFQFANDRNLHRHLINIYEVRIYTTMIILRDATFIGRQTPVSSHAQFRLYSFKRRT
jgi:hypothetical protein